MSSTASPWLRRVQLRLWHRLLTPGWIRPTPADRLRGWARVLDWRDARTPAQRLYVVRRAIWTPVRAWKEAGQAVAQSGAEVAAAAGVPPGAQRRQLWWLAVRHGLNASSYVDYQLYRPERHRQAAQFVQEREHSRVVWWLHHEGTNRDGYAGRDKSAFEAWCRIHGLASVPTLLEFEDGAVVASTLDGEPAHALPRCDLFSKPAGTAGGFGAVRWRWDAAAGGWRGENGRMATASELLDSLIQLSRTLPPIRGKDASRRVLLQPCVQNHPALRPLAPRALSTVRLLTYREPDGQGRIVASAFRMGVGDAPGDNFHLGGIVAPVELKTGQLGPALQRQGRLIVPVGCHPDTGAAIDGFQLPLWPQVTALVLRAFEAAFDQATIGWDVAIAPDGPLLIEANTASEPRISQAPVGVPLSATPFPAAIEAHVRRRLGA